MNAISFAPLSSRVLQRLPGSGPFEKYAIESTVICEPEEQRMRPAIYPSGELDHITNVHEFSSGLEHEIFLTTCDWVHHQATVAWRLRNVVLTNGMLCNYKGYKKMAFGRPPFMPAQVERVEETSALCSTDAGNDYFAHFVLDDATTAGIGEKFGRVTFGGSLKPRTQHMLDYLGYFDIPYLEKIHAEFADLWMFTDYPQNSHRRARLKGLQSALAKRFRGKQHPTPVYLKRGESGLERTLENEAEIERLLVARGFRVINPETMTTEELCEQLNGSPLVIGVEGSQLAHAILNMAAGGGLLCIQPAARFNAVYRGFTNSLDLEWGFVVAHGNAHRFRLEANRLMYTVDQMMEKSRQPC